MINVLNWITITIFIGIFGTITVLFTLIELIFQMLCICAKHLRKIQVVDLFLLILIIYVILMALWIFY